MYAEGERVGSFDKDDVDGPRVGYGKYQLDI